MSGLFGNWQTLKLDSKVFQEEKKNASIGKSVLLFLIAYLLMGIVVIFIIISSMNSAGTIPIRTSETELVKTLIIPIALIGVPIIGILGVLIGNAIIWLFARIFGGKGSFTEQFYLNSICILPITIISLAAYAVFFLLIIAGSANLAALMLFSSLNMIISLGIGIYTLVLLTIAIREAHSFSTGKAILSWLAPIIILTAIMLLLFLPLILLGLSLKSI